MFTTYSLFKSIICIEDYTKSVLFILKPFKLIAFVGSIYATVAISVERYLGICHPTLECRNQSRMYIVPVFLISTAVNIPTVWSSYKYFSKEKSDEDDVEKQAWETWNPLIV